MPRLSILWNAVAWSVSQVCPDWNSPSDMKTQTRPRLAFPLSGVGDAGRLAQPLSQRPGHQFMAGRVLGANHFDRAPIAVEFQQTVRAHASRFDQGGVKDQRVLRGREDEPIVVRRPGAVERGTR